MAAALICRVLSPPNYEPSAFSYADRYEAWHVAMQDEIQVLRSNDTWFLVSFHPLMNVLDCRWAYKTWKATVQVHCLLVCFSNPIQAYGLFFQDFLNLQKHQTGLEKAWKSTVQVHSSLSLDPHYKHSRIQTCFRISVIITITWSWVHIIIIIIIILTHINTLT